MPQPINLPPETSRKCVAGRIIHVGEWVMNWKGSRECAAPSVALWDGCGVGWKHRSIALRSSLVLERRVSTSDCVFTISDGVGLHVLARRLRNLSCASMEKWTWCFPLISPVIFLIHDSKSWIVPVALRKHLVSGCPANRLTQNCLGRLDRYASNCIHMSVQVLRHPDRFQKSR